MKRICLLFVVCFCAYGHRLSAQGKPLDQAAVLAGADTPAVQAGAVSLDGDWRNADPATRGLARIVVSGKKVHPYGTCHPKNCDWGSQKGQTFASAVDAKDIAALLVSLKTSFSNGVMTVSMEPDGRLRVQQFVHYADGGRADTSFVDYFVRTRR